MKSKPQLLQPHNHHAFASIQAAAAAAATSSSQTPSPPLISSQNSPQILTRSAAQRANHATSSSPVVIAPSTTRSNSRSNNNNNNNHINNGKIVKPIALRALSSSSSVSSLSTNLSANQTAKNALIASSLLESHQQQQQHQYQQQACTCQIKPCKCVNFSLIAKYFASFPANRLKQSTSKINNNNTISPFAIPQSVKNKDADLCKHFNHIVQLNDTTTPPLVSSATTTPIPQHALNTSALVYETEKQQIISEKATTPSSLVSPVFSSSITPTNGLASISMSKPIAFISPIQLPTQSSLSVNLGAGGDEDDSYNQITMETRSTRKFLIKYHPYLQNRILNSDAKLLSSNLKAKTQLKPILTTTTASTVTSSNMALRKLRKRPSINLIKMKNTKLSSSPSSPLDVDSSNPVLSALNNRARTTDIRPVDKLVNFIDIVDQTKIKNQQQEPMDSEYSKNLEAISDTDKKIICNCNAAMQQYTQKVLTKQHQQQQEEISSICGSKSSNADADSGYYSDLNFKLNDSFSSSSSFPQHHQHQTVLPKHNYYTRYNAAASCKLNCSSASSNCTCDLDLNQIEND